MIIYNITTKVAWPAHAAWVQWMLDIHIPEVLGTGSFEKHQFVKLLEIDDEEGPTYAVQYHAVSMEKYQQFIKQYSGLFIKKSMEKWGDQTISFRSLMEVVN